MVSVSLRTAEEMAQWCEDNNTGSGFSKRNRLKHFKVVEENLHDNETVKGCFCGIHNYKSMGDHDYNHAYAITDKRIIAGQKKVIGDQVMIVSRKHLNDIKMSTGLMFGLIAFDTIKEKFNVQVDKKETKAIHKLLVHELFEDSEPSNVNINVSGNEEPKASKSAIEQLKEYKELLDLDIISREEFDKKKAELL